MARGLPYRAQQLLGYRASPALNAVVGLDSDNLLNKGGAAWLQSEMTSHADSGLEAQRNSSSKGRASGGGGYAKL